jgi:16S rRNA (uracil1498-N3)-methyltransferase
MTVPYFFIETLTSGAKELVLDEETSRHIIQSLRMKEGELIRLTDGNGNVAEASLLSTNRKHAVVQIGESHFSARQLPLLAIGISLIKNTSRFEWFLEKAVEFGTAEIIPLICERTVKEKFRLNRMIGICKSAMLQSMQSWMPVLKEPVLFDKVISDSRHQQKMIAHCAHDHKRSFSSLYNSSLDSQIVLIGPEGDFSENEIKAAKEHHFTAVSLGETRLRTETAGIFAAAWASGARDRESD